MLVAPRFRSSATREWRVTPARWRSSSWQSAHPTLAAGVMPRSPLRWRGPSGREDKSSRAEPGRRTLGLDDCESTQCVCWPARSTRSASALAGAGRRRHRTWVHAKPQLRADRKRGRATDDAERLEIGEHQVRCHARVDTRIHAAAGVTAGCSYSPASANVQRTGLVRRMVSGRDTGSARAAGAVGGGSACGRAPGSRSRGTVIGSQRTAGVKPLRAGSSRHRKPRDRANGLRGRRRE